MFSYIIRVSSILLLGIGLSGCLTQSEFKDLAAALKKDPALKAYFVKKCVGEPLHWNADMREALATVVPVADSRKPGVVCERYANGIASGRLSYKDVQSFSQGELTPAMARVLRGS